MSEVILCGCRGCTQTRKQERDRIRKAVQALEPLLNEDKYKGGYDCCGCSTTYDLFADVMSIVDGEDK